MMCIFTPGVGSQITEDSDCSHEIILQGQRGNILSFTGYTVPAATAQCCHLSRKRLLPSQQPQCIHQRKACVPIKLYFWNSENWISHNFHISQSIIILWFFFQTFENIKPVSIYGLYKNSVRFESVDCNLTSPAWHQKEKKNSNWL